MITTEEVEKAVDFIRDNASKLAKCKAERVYLEEWKKTQKALLINECESGTIQAKESYAYSHIDYQKLLLALRVAVEESERLKWLMVAAQVKTEIWRTQQANNRFLDGSTS